MSARTQQIAILSVLVLVMVAVYARPLTKLFGGGARALRRPTTSSMNPPSQSAMPASSPTPAPEHVPPPPRVAGGHARGEQRQWLTSASWKRDPFTRGATIGEFGELKLSGILWDANAPMAIINGEMRRAGEELDGYRIVEIGPDHVSVTDGVDTFQLPVAP